MGHGLDYDGADRGAGDKTVKQKRKKIALLGTGLLISVLIAAVILAGLVFYQFSNPAASFEQKGNLAFESGDYAVALQYWINAKDYSQDPSELYRKIGNVYLKLSNLDQAEASFKKVLEKVPRSPDIQKQVIRIALARGDIIGAEKILAGLGDRVQDDSELMTLSGDLCLLQGDPERGRVSYETAAALSPDKIRPRLKLAICLVELEQQFEADKIVTQCRGDGIRNAMDLMLLADYYQLTEDDKRAERSILRAIESDPGNLGFKTRLCRFYRLAGMRDEAGGYLMSLVQEYPDNTGFRMMLADHYLSVQDMDAAELMLSDLKQTKAAEFGYHLLMGKFWLFKGRYSHAVSYLKNALEKNYGLVSAHYLLGVAYFAGGQTKLGENAFIKALMLDPNHGESLMALAGLNYKNREYDLAIQYIDRALSLDPSDAGSWQVKGLCFLEKEAYSQASQFFSKAWYLGGDVSSLFFLGQAFEGQGLDREALDAYEAVLEKSPGMYDALLAYAGLMASVGKGTSALENIDKWIKQGGGHRALYYLGAKISLNLGAYDRCRAYLDMGMGKTPVPGAFFVLQADFFRAKGDDGAVEAALTDCTKDRPQFVDGWLHLSGYYAQRQNFDRAAEVLEQGIKFFPDHPEIMGNLAWLLLEKKTDFDRALDLARTAYDRLPGEAWLMDTLGWAYYHKKVYSQAEWMLAQAAELSPDNGLIQYHLGMVLYRLGRLAEARETLESSLGCDRLSPMDLDGVQKVLAGLNGTTVPDNAGDDMLFDPDAVPSLNLPGLPDGEEDMLKPDWSKMNSS